ncbi:hypothetical protein C8Q76DRAFT_783768 [Earliella scabrosa]|nr:hypothetical protein C8Q76DRAFT_783768 [Earliella scabrosa]
MSTTIIEEALGATFTEAEKELIIRLNASSTATEAFNASLRTQPAVLDDIGHLQKHVQDIGTIFQHISSSLRNPKIRSSNIHRRFNNLVNTSRNNAQEVAKILRTFVDLELLSNFDIKDIKDQVQNHSEEIEKHRVVAKDVENGFMTLVEDIEQLKDFVETQRKQAKTFQTTQLVILAEEADNIRRELASLEDQVKRLGGASYIASLSIGAAVIGFAVLTLLPASVAICAALGAALSVAIAAVGQSIAIEDKARELSDVKEKIKDSNIPLAELDREVAELEEYMRSFEVANGDITRLAAEIYVIINIWHSLRLDIVKISTKLLLVNRATAKNFLRRFRVTQNLYKHLAELLEEYARQSVTLPYDGRSHFKNCDDICYLPETHLCRRARLFLALLDANFAQYFV